jgi:hypothetical protein
MYGATEGSTEMEKPGNPCGVRVINPIIQSNAKPERPVFRDGFIIRAVIEKGIVNEKSIYSWT